MVINGDLTTHNTPMAIYYDGSLTPHRGWSNRLWMLLAENFRTTPPHQQFISCLWISHNSARWVMGLAWGKQCAIDTCLCFPADVLPPPKKTWVLGVRPERFKSSLDGAYHGLLTTLDYLDWLNLGQPGIYMNYPAVLHLFLATCFSHVLNHLAFQMSLRYWTETSCECSNPSPSWLEVRWSPGDSQNWGI